MLLSTLEILGNLLPTDVEEQAEGERDVEVDPEHVRLDRGAEAHGGLQVNETVDESTARLLQRGPDRDVD